MFQNAYFISRLIRPSINRLFSPTGLAQAKLVHTQAWEFKDSHREISGVYHHTINLEQQDNNADEVATVIYNTIVKHPDALFFLTQKSRLLQRSNDNPNHYLPLGKGDLSNIRLMIDLINKQWLRPDGGHTCMAITDGHGSILEDTHVSLRPGKKRILSGQTALHRSLYPKFPGAVSEAQHTTIDQEILRLASNMLLDRNIAADLTVIPLASTNVELKDILENIRSSRALKLYNLCSLIVKQKDIDEITDSSIRQYVKELKLQARKFPELQQAITSDSETILSALACTHAIAKACYGNSYAIDEEIGSDQDTQTAAVYCTMALLGSEKFIEFARNINFLDSASRLTKK